MRDRRTLLAHLGRIVRRDRNRSPKVPTASVGGEPTRQLQTPPVEDRKSAGRHTGALALIGDDTLIPSRLLSASTYRQRPAAPSSIKPAVAVDAFSVGALTVRCASVRGDLHRRASERQDDYSAAISNDGLHLVVAVADGVSEATHAGIASGVASTAAVDHLMSAPDALTEAIDAAREALREEARAQRVAQRELSTTLAIVSLSLRDPVVARFAIIGDATIAVVTPDGEWLARMPEPTASPDTLPRCGASRALTEDVPLEHRQTLLLMTDGLGDGLRSAAVRKELAGYWTEGPPSGLNFAAQVGVECDQLWDDRTAIAIWNLSDHPDGDL